MTFQRVVQAIRLGRLLHFSDFYVCLGYWPQQRKAAQSLRNGTPFLHKYGRRGGTNEVWHNATGDVANLIFSQLQGTK